MCFELVLWYTCDWCFPVGGEANREDVRRFSFTKNFRKLPWKGPSSEKRVPFDSSPIRLNARHQTQDGGTDIEVNSLELVITCENT